MSWRWRRSAARALLRPPTSSESAKCGSADTYADSHPLRQRAGGHPTQRRIRDVRRHPRRQPWRSEEDLPFYLGYEDMLRQQKAAHMATMLQSAWPPSAPPQPPRERAGTGRATTTGANAAAHKGRGVQQAQGTGENTMRIWRRLRRHPQRRGQRYWILNQDQDRVHIRDSRIGVEMMTSERIS